MRLCDCDAARKRFGVDPTNEHLIFRIRNRRLVENSLWQAHQRLAGFPCLAHRDCASVRLYPILAYTSIGCARTEGKE